MTARHVRIAVADAPAVGEVRLVELDGHTIGFYRVGDQYHAVANRCPHRGAPLCSAGRVVRGIALVNGSPTRGAAYGLLRCPWHKWDFDIATGRCLVQPRLRVRRYHVERDGDDLIITLQHPARETWRWCFGGQSAVTTVSSSQDGCSAAWWTRWCARTCPGRPWSPVLRLRSHRGKQLLVTCTRSRCPRRNTLLVDHKSTSRPASSRAP